MIRFYSRINTVTLAVCLFSCQGYAAGLVANDRALRDDLTWLSGRKLIRLNLSTWPLSQDEIQRALLTLRFTQDPVNRQVINRIQKRLLERKAPLQVSAFASSGRDKLPQGMGQVTSAEQTLSASINSHGDFWDLTLRGELEGEQSISDSSHLNPNGSYGALRFANQWLSFGEIPQWWGPGNDASLIRSDAARPVVGFMMQRDEQLPSILQGLHGWEAGNTSYLRDRFGSIHTPINRNCLAQG